MPKLAFRVTMPRPDDPVILDRIATATRRGHPLHTAATLAGIVGETARSWKVRGQEAMEQNPDTPPQELGPHAVFAAVLNEAVAYLVAKRLKRIDKAGQRGNWAADMTLLERRFPQDFGRNQTVSIKQESLTVVLQGTLPPGAEHELIAQAYARSQAAQRRIEAGGGAED